MSAVFGVYIGCTSSCMAVCSNGTSRVIANNLGHRVTPACVGFTEIEVNVGLEAKENSYRNSTNTIFNVKRILGKNFPENAEELESYISKSSVKISRKNDQPVFQVNVDDKLVDYQPIEIASLIFKNLFELATNQNGQENSYEAVLTVPVYFNSEQRNVIRKAAESAGFVVLRIINECTSPLLAYNIGQDDQNLSCNVLVLRFGGQSTDVSVLKVTNGMYRVEAHHHDDTLGGNVVDNVLVDFFVEEFKRLRRMDCSKNERSKAKLRLAAEFCKHGLTSASTSTMSVDSLYDGIDFTCNLSRSRLDNLCAPFVQSCAGLIHWMITERAGLRLVDIQKVVMCGGVSKMPQLKKQLQDLLPTSEFYNNIAPDEVIAVGAALQAAILTGKDTTESELCSTSCELPCLSSDISLEVADGKKEVLFHKGTTVPFRKELTFPMTPEKGALLHLMQGDRSLLKMNIGDNTTEEKVNVAFNFKLDGSLHVTCSDSSGRHLADATLESSSKLESPRKSTRTSTDVNSS